MILTNDGYVYVWGLNENGELGTGTYNKVKEPTLLNYVSDVIDIALGKNHSLLFLSNRYNPSPTSILVTLNSL